MPGYKNWVAGDILAAADMNDYLSKQVIGTYADAAARNTALSAVLRDGLYADLRDADQLFRYDGTAWQHVAGLCGTEVFNTSFAVGTGALSVIAFTSESWDTNGFHTGSASSLVVPAGMAGKYLVTARTNTSTVSGLSALLLYKTSTQLAISHIPAGGTGTTTTAVTGMGVGDYIECSIYNGNASSLNWYVVLEITRLGT